MKKYLKKIFACTFLSCLAFFSVFQNDSNDLSFVSVSNNTFYADYQPNVTVTSSTDLVDIITKPYDNFTAWKSGLAMDVEIYTSLSRLSNTQSMLISYTNSYYHAQDEVIEEWSNNITIDSSITIPFYTEYYNNIMFGDSYYYTRYISDFVFTFNYSNLYQYYYNGTYTNYLTYGESATDYYYAYNYRDQIISPYVIYVYSNELDQDEYKTINDFNLDNILYIDHIYKPLIQVNNFTYGTSSSSIRNMPYNCVYEVIYHNADNYNLVFTCPIYNANSKDTLSIRQYLTNYDSITNSDIYQTGYNDGYSSGLNTSQSNSYNSGYDQGYNTGYDQGYNSGYNVAINENNTFGSLMFSVVDAPVQVFTSLLDFDILGINMSQFAISLLSIGLLVAILRFIL